MKTILIVGDSFCAWRSGWPEQLATMLNLKLTGTGIGGTNWWATKTYLKNNPTIVNDAEIIVFVHSFPDRLFVDNPIAPTYDWAYGGPPTTEDGQAKYLYFKYIFNGDFHNWATEQWFKEIRDTLSHKRMCHLHVSTRMHHAISILPGLQFTTPLMGISLNETAALDLRHPLTADTRANHLSDYNNTELARQIAAALSSTTLPQLEFDVSKFQLSTTKWFSQI